MTLSSPIWTYWGKAKGASSAVPCHLLVCHSMDVAAVGQQYLMRAPSVLQFFADALEWPLEVCRSWLVYWLALHDLGKFSNSFQTLRPDLALHLHADWAAHPHLAGCHHDCLGYELWLKHAQDWAEVGPLFGTASYFSAGFGFWARAFMGHHGQPPRQGAASGEAVFESPLRSGASHWYERDVQAASAYAQEMQRLLLTPEALASVQHLDPEVFELRSKSLSHWLAGFAVLCDWLGSNADVFGYVDCWQAPVADYWVQALQKADTVLTASGVVPTPSQPETPFASLFARIAEPSPLQQWAAACTIAPGPQIVLMEDAAGAGKTEAAMMLAHRLMASGVAQGFFVGLPTMATANAMYERIAGFYAVLFVGQPHLVLAHGSKEFVERFAASVLPSGEVEEGALEKGASPDAQESASARCSLWLADHHKRALLAQAGVGTIDQALLAVLQSKHQCLRLLGLLGKVLIVDEVHACDPYMEETLAQLLRFHARAGGSVILLSATLPRRMKQALLTAFAQGSAQPSLEDHRAPALPALQSPHFPLVTQWSASEPLACTETPMAVRPAMRRSVALHCESDLEAVLDHIRQALAQGLCVLWIRNTVADAIEAWSLLAPHIDPERSLLFHARMALGDRLAIEAQVLARLGPDSNAAVRAGQLLIATQVVEQSLDIDADVLVSDLAPVDRLIQRLGRFRRHRRRAHGNPWPAEVLGHDERKPMPAWVYAPAWVAEPTPQWFSAFLPKAARVYPHHAQLWRTRELLQQKEWRIPEDVRGLMRHVFDDGDQAVPPGFAHQANRVDGQQMAERGQSHWLQVKLDAGYSRDQGDWMQDTQAPSRLGEATLELYLARWVQGALLPWHAHPDVKVALAYSKLQVPARLIAQAVPDPETERQATIDAFKREHLPAQGRFCILLALSPDGTGTRWSAQARPAVKEGQNVPAQTWLYDAVLGLRRGE